MLRLCLICLKKMRWVSPVALLVGLFGLTGPAQLPDAPGFLLKWGAPGGGPGEFSGPEGVAIGSDGRVYVADTYNHRIQVFDRDGQFLLSWGSLCDTEMNQGCQDSDGSGPLQMGDGQFKTIEGIAVDPLLERVYLADSENHRVQVFDADGKFLFKWGSFGSIEGQFYLPVGLAVDALGFVYVADVLNHRIEVFNADGQFVRQWGREGSDPGQFKYPTGLAVFEGSIFVTDNGNHRVQRFDLRGNFLGTFGSFCNLAAGEECVDPDGAGPLQSGDGQLHLPFGIATDEAGRVYVMDQGNNRVEVFTSDGQYLGKWGQTCAVVEGADPATRAECRDPDLGGPLELGDGQFYSPKGIAVGSDGRIYVADSDNHRIQVFQR